MNVLSSAMHSECTASRGVCCATAVRRELRCETPRDSPAAGRSSRDTLPSARRPARTTWRVLQNRRTSPRSAGSGWCSLVARARPVASNIWFCVICDIGDPREVGYLGEKMFFLREDAAHSGPVRLRALTEIMCDPKTGRTSRFGG